MSEKFIHDMREKVIAMEKISEIQEMLSCSRHLIASVAKEQRQADAAA